MGVYIPYSRLPSEYQEVEYIESSGTQYIDTGVNIGNSTNNEIIEGKIQFNSNSSVQANGKNQKKVLFFGTNASNVFYAGIGDNYGNTSLTNDSNTHIFKISQSEYKLYVDGTGYTLTSTAFSGDIYSSNIYIGACSDGYTGTARFHCKENIYYFKIWQGGNLVRDFVPCYRKSDSVIGLYDIVNNQFYTNSGTGTFSKGNDVIMSELKNAYIGEVWTPTSNTLAYYPFTDNQLDVTGKTTLPISGTLQPIGCRFSVSGSPNYQISVSEQPNFFSFWLKVNSFGSQGNIGGIWNNKYGIQYYINHNNGTWVNKIVVRGANNTLVNGPSNISQWNHICFGGDGNNYIVGVNGNITNITDTPQSITSQMFQLVSTYMSAADFDISEMIVENTARTSDKIQNYYNNTKSNYGF